MGTRHVRWDLPPSESSTDGERPHRQRQPDARLAQPRDEQHLLPLFTALGAAREASRARAIHRGIRDHVIAMDSHLFEQVL